eukprot:72537_1
MAQQNELFGSSYVETIMDWNHLSQTHNINDINKITDEIVCKELNCKSVSRHRKRRNTRKGRTQTTFDSYQLFNSQFNDNIQQILKIEKHYQTEVDTIHYNIFHRYKTNERRKSKQIKIDVETDVKYSDDNELIGGETQLIEEIEMTEFESKSYEAENDMYDDDINGIKDRYNTNIGLFGFGIDHQHHHSGPDENNNCLKTELINTKLVIESIWNSIFLKAKVKWKSVAIDNNFRAKQYSEEYNILRGDPILLVHILVICFYTDQSVLCYEYRSCYRRMENDKNDNDIRRRHRRYYFLSRYLWESCEFFGNPIRNEDVVYHGLDKQLLFSNFSRHFNAPMSTTPEKQSSANFAGAGGIILKLKNGNPNINPIHVIALFEKQQARYLNVNWISAHKHESEWLFFGSCTIFEVVDIIQPSDRDRSEIPENTLKQLNLLQKIIKNQDIEWENNVKRAKSLSVKLHKTRDMILKFMDYNIGKGMDEIDYLFDYLQNHKIAFNDENFSKKLRDWYEMNAYDKESLMEDIGENGDKNESNFYIFLKQYSKQKYFNITYKILQQYEQQRISDENAQYWKKLFKYFCLSQTEFICIQKPFDIESILQQELFKDNNNNNNISITKLTDIFYNVKK